MSAARPQQVLEWITPWTHSGISIGMYTIFLVEISILVENE
jgi:hypothetical protein